MKVLIIGGGGREHAIAWKVAQNSKVEKIYCAPGNGGTAIEEKCENVAITKIEELITFVKENSIEITIVGPEAPLTEGVVDAFKEAGLKIFGPSRHGAKLEGSKIFSKDFMKKYGIKTAQYETFDHIDNAREYLKKCIYPTVIKADGLAAGKGVVICANEEEAVKTLEEFMIDDIFKGAGKNIVIEEFLEGVEASILSITDGKTIIPFLSAKDHKQIFDENKGPNTGGMGVIAPNPYCTEEVLELFNKDIVIPTLEGIKAEKMDFTGIIFFGVMINKNGAYLIEYNVRMGDPETEAVLLLMESDFLDLILAAVNGDLSSAEVKWSKGSACCVVAASGGYPGNFQKGYTISIDNNMDSKVFMAGAKAVDGKVVTDGGRVLCVTAVDETLEKAIKKAYEDIKNVSFEKMYYRKDIGTLYQ
jgi:phosphoribosylamine--glycine ligase